METVCVQNNGVALMMRSYPEDDDSGSMYPTCFVCGIPNCANSVLSLDKTIPEESVFPFLKLHDRPVNAQPIINDKVLACELCAKLLKIQWKNFEDTKVPPVKRIYWVKREDGLPFSGVEMGMQTEYASQFLGLAPDPVTAVVDERINYGNRTLRTNNSDVITRRNSRVNVTAGISKSPNSSISQTIASQSHHHSGNRVIAKRVPASLPEPLSPPPPPPLPLPPQQQQQPPSPPIATTSSTTVNSKHSTANRKQLHKCKDFTTAEPQVEALDLSVDRRQANDKTVPVLPSVSYPAEVLDLSMPDKNASTEVCYVCGDHFTRGTLIEMFAKEQSLDQPFFPSLMYHARPSKSHPMEASGCVQGCTSCLKFLFNQWCFFNSKNIEHKIREYLLINKPARVEKDFSVICFECHEHVDAKSAQAVFTSNPDSKSYLLDVEKRQSFSEGQLPSITAKIICSECCLKKHTDASSEGSNDTIDICETSSPKPKRKRINIISHPVTSPAVVTSEDLSLPVTKGGPLAIRPEAVEECSVSCYLCHQIHAKNCMYWVAMLPESSSSDGLYFPFIKNILRSSNGVVSEDGRVLTCSLCYHHLRHQWEDYDLQSVTVERRMFSCRVPSLGSSSPQRTPNMSPPSSASDTQTALETQSKLDFRRNLRADGQLKTFQELELDLSKIPASSYVVPSISSQNPLKIAIRCFLCGFSSKEGETYLVGSKKQSFSQMSFPFLEGHATPNKDASVGNNNFLTCTFCYHTMTLQWQHFEKLHVEPYGRFYDTYNFSCYVCAQKTYRKRLRTLHVEVRRSGLGRKGGL